MTNKEILLKMVDLLEAKGKSKVSFDFGIAAGESEAYFLSRENFSIMLNAQYGDYVPLQEYAEDLMSYKSEINSNGNFVGFAIITMIFDDEDAEGVYFTLNDRYPDKELFNILRFAIKYCGKSFEEEN